MTLGRRPLLIVLAAANLLLAGALVYELSAPLPEPEPPVMRLRPKAQPAAVVAAVTTPAPEAFADIDLRPPFSANRKPVAASEAGAAQALPPELTLVGVIVGGTDSLAMLRTPAAPLADAYRVGATISGWRLTEIAPDHIVLNAGGVRSEIRLDANKPKPPPPAAPGSSQ